MSQPKHRRARRTQRKRRGCESKVTYYSQMGALSAAVRTGLRWYKCPYCHHYHLTKAVKHRPRKR